jgi:hypothetical protein
MHTPLAVIALSACLTFLGACNKTPVASATPMVDTPVATGSGTTAGYDANTSVPTAESVFAPASAPKTDEKAGRSNDTLGAVQESVAMPVPGQNNDHSAPLDPAKRASAP